MLVIRLRKRGRKKLNIYDIVVTNKRSARDGKYIEKIGTYNSVLNPSKITLKEDIALKWLKLGSETSKTVRNILSNAGIIDTSQNWFGTQYACLLHVVGAPPCQPAFVKDIMLQSLRMLLNIILTSSYFSAPSLAS